LEAGRLYRSGTRFSSEQLHQYHQNELLDDNGSYDCDHLVGGGTDLGGASSPLSNSGNQQTAAEDSGGEDPHRSSFVKFAEGDSDGDDDKETPFVRHNTPHPKDLKAKAQKHFKGIFKYPVFNLVF